MKLRAGRLCAMSSILTSRWCNRGYGKKVFALLLSNPVSLKSQRSQVFF